MKLEIVCVVMLTVIIIISQTVDAQRDTNCYHQANCLPGEFCDPNSVRCQNCPSGQYQHRNGHYMLSCIPCDCTNCEVEKDGSGRNIGCRCEPGYYATGVDDNSQVTGCTTCETNSWSDANNDTNKEVCSTCAAGYRRIGAASDGEVAVCEMCESCTWSRDGDIECNLCVAGKYRTVFGACNNCPQGTYSEDGSATDFHGCTDCPATTFSASGAAGVGGCNSCGFGYIKMGTDSDTGAADCVQCPANTWRYVDPNDETTQTDGDCNICAPGFHANGFTGAINGKSASCVQCPTGTMSHSGALDEADCYLCAPGYYRSREYESGITAVCDSCPIGTWNVANQMDDTACMSCTMGKTTENNGTASVDLCVCPPGTFLTEDDTCEECPIGEWNDLYNQISCTRCDGGKTTQNTRSVSIDDCVCVCGQYLNSTGGCSFCPVGTIQTDRFHTNNACDNCTAGSTTSQEGASLCDVCLPGWENTNLPGLPPIDPASCQRCVMNMVNPVVGGDCVPCSGSTYSNADNTLCGCGPGKYLVGEDCMDCGEGTYQDTEFHTYDMCKNCSDVITGSTTNGTGAVSADACVCIEGQYWKKQDGQELNQEGPAGMCLSCAEGSYQDSTYHRDTYCKNCSDVIADSTTKGTGSTTSVECKCRQGQVVNGNGNERQCIPCSMGSFQSMDYHTQKACSQCTAVTTGSTTTGAGSTASTDCTCVAGQYLDAENGCTSCDFGTFQDSPFHREVACKNCTICGPGYQLSGESCVQCEGNSGNPDYNSECTACDAKMVANANKTVCETECPAGEELIGDTCTTCQSGFYKSEAGNEMCEECPTNTEAIQGTDRTTCQCIGGTEGDGLTCIQCLKSYHPGGQPGIVTCTQCPGNSFAPDGSTSADDCQAPTVTTTVPARLVIDSVDRDECIADDYENPNSPAYRRVEAALLRLVLRSFATAIGVNIHQIRCGSVDVDYSLIFDTVDPPAPEQLTQTLQQSIQQDGGLITDNGITFQVNEESIVFQEPIREGDERNNSWVFIIVGGVGVIIVGAVAVLFVYKVRSRCMFHDPELVRQYTGPDLNRERPPIGQGHLGDDWRTRSKTCGRYSNTSDIYKGSILGDRRRTIYRNSIYTSPYYKYGY